MGDVVDINQKKFFTLDEARALLPIVKRITASAEEDIKALSLQHGHATTSQRKVEIEERVKNRFHDWCQKLQKLGCETKGMWLVDFDNGEGYFCWNHPEPELDHFHGYDGGFKGRVKIH